MKQKNKQDLEYIRQELKLRSKNNTLSVADTEDLRSLEELERKEKQSRKGLQDLEKRTKELEAAIEYSSTLFASSEIDKHEELPAFAIDTMDCVSCGKAIPQKKFGNHLEQCYVKKEGFTKQHGRTTEDGMCNHYDSKTNSYCNKPLISCTLHPKLSGKGKCLQGRLCGCPTTDYESTYCERLRDQCSKHTGWQSLRKAELAQERKILTKQLEDLDKEATITKLRISRRNHPPASQENKTIAET